MGLLQFVRECGSQIRSLFVMGLWDCAVFDAFAVEFGSVLRGWMLGWGPWDSEKRMGEFLVFQCVSVICVDGDLCDRNAPLETVLMHAQVVT
jgi:hypothetical protein